MLVHERGRCDDPSHADRRCQRLRDRAEVDRAVRRERLHRAERLAVVAELRVVVVLDDPTARPPSPVNEPAPPLETQDGSHRVLVSRGDQDRVHISPLQHVEAHAVLVHGDRDDLAPAASNRWRGSCPPGSSTAMRSQPAPTSVATVAASASAKPPVSRTRSFWVRTPRTRAR